MSPTPLRALALLALATLPAWAHFPIALPERLALARGQTTRIEYAFGHPFEATRAPAPPLAAAWLYPPEGERHALASQEVERAGTRAFALEVTPQERGDHLLVLEGKPHGHGDETVRDLVKLILPVGGVQRGWDRDLGLPLEIVPLTRPYGLSSGAHLRFEVRAKGRPLPGAQVEVERLNRSAPDPLPSEPFLTQVEKANAHGEAAASLTSPGWWVVACSAPDGSGGQLRAVLWVHVGQP